MPGNETRYEIEDAIGLSELKGPSVYLRWKKDIFFSLFEENSEGIVPIDLFYGHVADVVTWSFFKEGRIYYYRTWIEDSKVGSCRFWLPPGQYRLILRDLDDEMTIRFKL